MKKFILITIILLGFTFNLNCQTIYGPLCCELMFTVTTELDDSCCVTVTLNNPGCVEGIVQFYKWDIGTSSFVIEESVNLTLGYSPSYTFCNGNNNGYIKYRIRIAQPGNPNKALCHFGDDQFVEGYSQFSDSIDVSSCCGCPEDVNDWLTLVVEKDSENCPNGCKVTPYLNIPDSITCYRYYSIATSPESELSEIRPMSELSTEWRCVGYGGTVEFIIVLLQSDDINVEEEYDNLCVIEKTSVSCDSCPCPPDADDWLNVVVNKDYLYCFGGCRVAMELNIPSEYSCFQYYDLIRPGFPDETGKSIASVPLSSYAFCISNNTSSYVTLRLKKYPNQSDETACIITKPITCDDNSIDPDEYIHVCDTCAQSPWIIWEDDFIFSDGRAVRVKYQTRKLCPPNYYQDIQILSIESLATFFGTAREIFEMVIIEIVKKNNMGFNPTNNPLDTNCYSTWRFLNKPCKMFIQVIDSLGHINERLVDCPTDSCCIQRMEVCRNIHGEVKITPLEIYTPEEFDCDYYPDSLLSFPPLIPNYVCFTTCEWLDIETNWITNPNKIGFENNGTNGYQIQYDGSYLYVECFDNHPCNYTVDIFNIIGVKILTFIGSSSSKKQVIDIRDKIISSGIFLYKLSIDGNIISTGKIIK